MAERWLRDFGNKLEATAYDLGGGVLSAATQVATTIKDAPASISSLIAIDSSSSDFDRIRALARLARQTNVKKGRKYTEQEWEEAEKRADAVLEKLPPTYFEQNFDPVKYELEHLSMDAGPEEIEAVVERLTNSVEKSTGKLARRVFTKRDQLLQGMGKVSSVEEEVKKAFIIVRTGRMSLKQSGEEIMRNLRVTGQTRRKQNYMELMEVCDKIRNVRQVQRSIRAAQDQGEHGEAMVLCVQSFQLVDQLKELQMWQDLRSTVQRLYVETLQKLDGALKAICSDFDPARYSKILEGYMLQGIQGKHLAERVLQCFRDAIYDATMKAVRSLLLAKAAESSAAKAEGSYEELCQNLPQEYLRPCLVKQMESLFDILASHYIMEQWHKECVKQMNEELEERKEVPLHMQGSDPATSSSTNEPEAAQAPAAHPPGESASAPPAAPVAAAPTLLGFLEPVSQVLSSSREEIFGLASHRVIRILTLPGLYQGDDYVQAVEMGYKFLGAGEAFLGSEAPELRALLSDATLRFFDSFHRGNMDLMGVMMQHEVWKEASAKAGMPQSIELDKAIIESPLYTPPYEEGDEHAFEKIVDAGNPFSEVARASKKQAASKWQSVVKKSLLKRITSSSDAQSVPSEEEPLLSPATPAMEGRSDFSMALMDDEYLNRPLQSWTLPGNEPKPSAKESKANQAAAGTTTTSGPPNSSTAFSSSNGKMVTLSSGQALKCIRAYGQLMRPLSSRSSSLFWAMCEVFDSYLLWCFILFSGVTLETLVFKDDILPTRLKNNLMRILLSPNSKYKFAVEELMRLKPAQADRPPPNSVGGSFLERFAHKMESIANDVEKSVDRMQNRINDKVLSQMPAAITSIASEVAASVERVAALGGGGGGGAGGGNAPNLYGLHERIAAIASLLHLAEELRHGKAAILARIPQQHRRDTEQYFSARGPLEASSDLRSVLFRGAARRLLTGLLDEDRGSSQQIAHTNYNLREPIMTVSPWSEHALRCYRQFAQLLSSVNLPPSATTQVWQFAIATGSEAIVDGLARIKKCTYEGRASMSFDLNHLERSVRALAPPGFEVAFRSADDYIKAFYLPWEELTRWCQVHLQEYSKYRIIDLVELVSETFKIKRHQKEELIHQIEAFSKEFQSASS